MKPKYLQITGPDLGSFSIRHERFDQFRDTWQYHAELELHYVIHGNGMRFVGDSVSNFSDGELILLGSNLPHCWQSVNSGDDRLNNEPFEVIVLQFLPYCTGSCILDLPEANALSKLFERAKNGMMLLGDTKQKIIAMMHELCGARDLDRLLLFFKILKELMVSEKYTLLTRYSCCYPAEDELNIQRVNQIFSYSTANYMNRITSQQMADLCHLTLTSFCRFFKTVYRKSYNDFLAEIRIRNACLMIAEGEHSIERICNLCGYHNISNFYRHFKAITGTTPCLYKRKFDRRRVAA